MIVNPIIFGSGGGGIETFTIARDFTAVSDGASYKPSICEELSNYISDWSDIVSIQQITPTNTWQKQYQIYGIHTDIEHLGFDPANPRAGIAQSTLSYWFCWGANKWVTQSAKYYEPMYLCAGDIFQITRLGS